jgi:hypothetical protein
MRLSNILLLAAAAILLGFTSALSTAKDSKAATISSGRSTSAEAIAGGRSLRVVATADEEDEERALNLNFLKNLQKKIPGVNSLKAAAAARAASAKAKKAEAAAKKLKVQELFTITAGTRDDQLFKKFAEWRRMKVSPGEAAEHIAKTMKISLEKASSYANRYQEWRMILP